MMFRACNPGNQWLFLLRNGINADGDNCMIRFVYKEFMQSRAII
jgi:hypothetical protein